MYLVISESEDGSWFDEPSGWDILDDAKRCALGKRKRVPTDVAVCIYRCTQVEVLEAKPETR